MATDFAVSLFVLPVLVGLIAVVLLAVRLKPAGAEAAAFLGLGARRIAFGFLGAMCALLAYAVADSIALGFNKVELGHVTAEQMPAMVPGWSFYLFILLAPFVATALSLAGLPLFALLRRFRLASVLGVLVLAAVYSGLNGFVTYIGPYNNWCSSHLTECAAKSTVESMFLASAVALGFAVGARLPVLRSSGAL
jgi:hypothetical protein